MQDSNPDNWRPKRRTVLKSGLAASSIGLAGCVDDEESDTLRVGAVVPTSGPYAETGQDQESAIEYAIDQFDGVVGGQDIEMFVRDSETSPDATVPRTTELIQEENVDILFGGFSSSVCLAMQDVAGREQVPYFSGGGASLRPTGENCNRYSFFAMASGWQYSGAAVAAHEQGIMDSLFFVQADYEGGEGVYQGVTTVLDEQTDVALEGRELVPLGADDYSAAISAARDSGADTVWAALVGADTTRFIEQAVSAGLDDDMTILVGVVGNSVAAALDPETTGSIYGGAPFYWTADGSREFSEDFRDETGIIPEWWTGVQYDGAMEAFTAVEETGSPDPDGLIDFLRGRSFEWSRTGTQWRACDHRAIQPYHFLEGLDEDGRSEEGEFWDVLGSAGGEPIMRTCEATGCQM